MFFSYILNLSIFKHFTGMQFICLKLDSEMYLDLNTSIIMKKLNTLIDTIIYWIHDKQVHKALLPYFRFLRHIPHMVLL